MKVLVCDDFPFLRNILSKILKTFGHQVKTAFDGQDALEQIQANPKSFDVLLTDNNMPRLTGIDLVKKLRMLSIPMKVIMISMCTTPMSIELKNRLQLNGSLIKPFTTDELLDCLNNL